MLSSHSQLHIPPETWFILPLVRELPLKEPLSEPQSRRAVDIILSDYRWPDLEIDAGEFRHAAAALPTPRLKDIVGLVYDRLLAGSGKMRMGDKTPPYIAIVPELAALFPGAQFIHLVRDGRDVSISQTELNFKWRFYDRGRSEWIAAMQKARTYRRSMLAAQYLEVQYEHLVGEPEATLRRICKFLGEAFEPGMLSHRPDTKKVPERERFMHGKLARPLSSDSVGVWRYKLSAVECFSMEACLRSYLRDVGYELRFKQPLWQPALAVTETVLTTGAPVLRRVMRYLRRRKLLARQVYF